MITSTLLSWFFSLLTHLLNGFDVLSLPSNFITLISNVVVYGTWVIGADLLGIIISTAVWWWTLKLVIGIVLFIWRLLPLT